MEFSFMFDEIFLTFSQKVMRKKYLERNEKNMTFFKASFATCHQRYF